MLMHVKAYMIPIITKAAEDYFQLWVNIRLDILCCELSAALGMVMMSCCYDVHICIFSK